MAIRRWSGGRSLVGRGNQAERGALPGIASDALVGALLHDPQQLGLQRQRQLADFIEKQRSAVGQPRMRLRACATAPVNAPRSWPKNSLPDSSGTIVVQSQDDAFAARRSVVELMDQPSDQFLAGPAFADQENGRIGEARDLDDPPQDGTPRRTRADSGSFGPAASGAAHRPHANGRSAPLPARPFRRPTTRKTSEAPASNSCHAWRLSIIRPENGIARMRSSWLWLASCRKWYSCGSMPEKQRTPSPAGGTEPSGRMSMPAAASDAARARLPAASSGPQKCSHGSRRVEAIVCDRSVADPAEAR